MVAKKIASKAAKAVKKIVGGSKKIMRGGAINTLELPRSSSKTCPAGVICFESFTFWILLAVIALVGWFIYNTWGIGESRLIRRSRSHSSLISNQYPDAGKGDILSNPYVPPERIPPQYIPPTTVGVPINMNTRPQYDQNYRQVGIMTKVDDDSDEPTILPVFGRVSPTGRDKWNYYTMSGGFNTFKLPINYKNRNCQDDNGCDELYKNDRIYVPQYKSYFEVDIYDLDRPRYIPTVL